MSRPAYPAKLFVEPTTYCNLKCRMCVKQSSGSGIVEGMLDSTRFTTLSKIFPYLDTVVFRKKVNAYAFPYCSNCNVGPCDLITSEEFDYDCFAMAVPCGDCPWCTGLMQCLQ